MNGPEPPWRWLRAIALLGALVAALWLAFVIVERGGHRPDGARPDMAMRPRDDARASIPPKAHEASVGAPTSSLPAEPHADEVQVCGGAWVRTQADGSIDPDELTRANDGPDARQRVVAALRAQPSELAHAAVLWLALRGTGRDRWQAMMDGAFGCDSAECRDRWQAVPQLAEARDGLAQMAVSSTDPGVYALAFRACGNNGGGACQMLNAEQWARLDPGNAAPWLYLLSAAHQHSDVALQNEALHRIATAQRSDTGFLAVPGLISAAVPSDETSMLAALNMTVEAIGMQAAVALPPYQPLVADCSGVALRDSNRRQTCAAIAEVLVARSDTLLETLIGLRVGRHVGWPAERIDQLRGEFNAYMQHAEPLVMMDYRSGGASCSQVRRSLDAVHRRAVEGEVGEMRAWVARSGKTPEEFVSEERARREAVLAASAREQADATSASAGGAPASQR